MRTLATFILVTFGILVVISLALAPLGFSQPRPRLPAETDSDALALARICRHEAGFPPRRGRGARAWWDHGDDCPAIYAVIERVRASLAWHREVHVTVAEAVHAYSRGRVYDRTRTDASCDVAWLDEAGTEPQCWRGDVPWSHRREAWLATVEHARAIVAGQITHRCAAPPLHWGCGRFPPGHVREGEWRCRDHERAARAGWVEVSCGRTDNAFYALPAAGPAGS